MAQNAPGRHWRVGLTLPELFRMFPDDAAAEKWFAYQRWGDEPYCPHCGSLNVQSGAAHKTMPYRCRDCRKRFSVRTHTVMESSNLGYQTWALAIYILTTSLRGVSSMKLHRELGITQKSAWHLAHRIRRAWEDEQGLFVGPVEVDETYVGGRERNRHASERRRQGRGAVNMTPVAGVVDRATNQVSSAPVEDTRRGTLVEFIYDRVEDDATVYSDDHGAYRSLPYHEVVRHSLGEYVRGEIHTNTIESHWAMLKRCIMGSYYHLSSKHLHRYTTEVDGRRNDRDSDTVEQMANIAHGMLGKRLKYEDLIA